MPACQNTDDRGQKTEGRDKKTEAGKPGGGKAKMRNLVNPLYPCAFRRAPLFHYLIPIPSASDL